MYARHGLGHRARRGPCPGSKSVAICTRVEIFWRRGCEVLCKFIRRQAVPCPRTVSPFQRTVRRKVKMVESGWYEGQCKTGGPVAGVELGGRSEGTCPGHPVKSYEEGGLRVRECSALPTIQTQIRVKAGPLLCCREGGGNCVWRRDGGGFGCSA